MPADGERGRLPPELYVASAEAVLGLRPGLVDLGVVAART